MEDEQLSGVEIAKNCAARVLSFKKLKVPIKIDSLLAQYAEVRELRFPTDKYSGLCINRKDRKPKVLINSGMTETRKRFTMAHELGHIQIFNHTGLIPCVVNEDPGESVPDADQYKKKETEANVFAAELLMPRDWVKDVIAEHDKVGDAINEIAEKAGVSKQAAFYRVIELLEDPGFVDYSDASGNEGRRFFGRDAGHVLHLNMPDVQIDREWLLANCQGEERYSEPTIEAEFSFFKRVPTEDEHRHFRVYLKKEADLSALAKNIKDNNISCAHLFYRCWEFLPVGYFVKVVYLKTGDSRFWKHKRDYWSNFNYTEEWVKQHSSKVGVCKLGDFEIWIYYVRPVEKVQYNTSDRRDSKEILRSLLNNSSLSESEKDRITRSINGIIGSANLVRKRSAGEITPKKFYLGLLNDIRSREGLQCITEQEEEFRLFLAKKTMEICGVARIS